MNNGRVSWSAALNVIAAVAVAGVIFWAVLAQQRVRKLEDRLAGIERNLKAQATEKSPVVVQPAATPRRRPRRPATLASTRPAATKPAASTTP